QIARLEGHKNAGIGCAFNHSGDLLASGDWDGTLRLWDPRAGRQLFQTQSSSAHLRFGPDDRLLTSGHRAPLRLLEVANPCGCRDLARNPVHHERVYFSCAVHRDGRLLAVGMPNEANLWDLDTGNHLASLPLGPGISVVLFEPSGALLTNSPN